MKTFDGQECGPSEFPVADGRGVLTMPQLEYLLTKRCMSLDAVCRVCSESIDKGQMAVGIRGVKWYFEGSDRVIVDPDTKLFRCVPSAGCLSHEDLMLLVSVKMIEDWDPTVEKLMSQGFIVTAFKNPITQHRLSLTKFGRMAVARELRIEPPSDD